MSADTPVILEVAMNGATSKETNPTVPRDPDEIAADALGCLEAGAAIIHTHSDHPAATGHEGAERYAAAYRVILGQRPDAILYPTVAFDPDNRPEGRYGHQRVLARDGLIRQGVLDPGAVNLGGADADGLPGNTFCYANTPADTRLAVAICAQERLGPSIAVFEPGYLRVVLAACAAGSLPRGAFVKFYFSVGNPYGDGAPTFGAPPIPEALEMYLAMIAGSGLPWATACLGGALLETPIARPTLERGGHLRVGLEDHPHALGNLDEVEGVRVLCETVGRPLATPGEAATLLDLPTPT